MSHKGLTNILNFLSNSNMYKLGTVQQCYSAAKVTENKILTNNLAVRILYCQATSQACIGYNIISGFKTDVISHAITISCLLE